MAKVNIALELFGLVITLILLLCCIAERHAARRQNSCFIAMALTNGAVLICDAVTWIFENQVRYTGLLYTANFLVYSLGYVLTAMFTHYLAGYLAEQKPVSLRIARGIDLLCTAAIGLVVVSLFNQMYFRFEAGFYIRGPLYWLSQLYPALIILADMILTVHWRKLLGFHDTLALLSYGLLPLAATLIQIYIYGITLLYLATTLSLMIIFIMIHAEQSRRLQEKELELTQAKISIMLSQIQPHFLYNALDAISYLCQTDPPRAEKAVTEFSKFLRGNMDSLTQAGTIPFERELTHTKNYLALEQVRFADRLRVVYDIQTTLFCLPPLTLQPIVENAVRYGVTKRPEGGTVTISTFETEDSFVITVKDDGVGFDPMQPKPDGRTHIGIQNVRARVEQQLNGTLVEESTPNVGTLSTITIPKDKEFLDFQRSGETVCSIF